MERNLHDGAQQRLVAHAVQLRLLERFAEDPDRVRQATGQLQGALQDAIEDLRDLARGIYPPLLDGKGLAVALEVQARRFRWPSAVGRHRSLPAGDRAGRATARSKRCRTLGSTPMHIRLWSALPRPTGTWSSRSKTTAAGSTRVGRATARACKEWRTASTRSVERSRWTRSRGTRLRGRVPVP
ncbi:MAG: histidine kinase [Actinomycetota bacterium]